MVDSAILFECCLEQVVDVVVSSHIAMLEGNTVILFTKLFASLLVNIANDEFGFSFGQKLNCRSPYSRASTWM